MQANKGGDAAANAVIILSAFSLSTGINNIAKVSGKRQRPAFH